MVVASAGRANRNDSSELVMRCMAYAQRFIPQNLRAIKFYDDGTAAIDKTGLDQTAEPHVSCDCSDYALGAIDRKMLSLL